ncbi:RNA polymerase sigma factor [Anaeromyxobacter oryzae]|uniref:RNA polymerase sigma24 factor n=1 Tax=Anaeromyxobacter oryzae TaxID=2918170 RepID=A0ABM7X2Q8_9BACT|nr:sigma-70 family RNA polymerase sigma factor [Anaeromyxobacter oryzae]BDG06065.1 RNA polymerase sigma24 factor [Anaeromyxobacter oryzae]
MQRATMVGTPAERPDEWELVAALRAGDEAAFLELVGRYHRSVVRVARAYLGSDAAAEDVAQEAWLGVLKGIDAFEGRCSVKTWIFRIAVYCAKTRRARDGRLVPMSALEEDGEDEPAVDPDRFQPDGARYANNWSRPPEPWAEERLMTSQAAALVKQEIERLPTNQRAVITLRDVEGLDSGEVCEALGLSDGNQRVLLHRARSKVRAALERLMSDGGGR